LKVKREGGREGGREGVSCPIVRAIGISRFTSTYHDAPLLPLPSLPLLSTPFPLAPDSLGFHKVGNPDAALGAVTFHCYIPPPKSTRVWLAARTAAADAMVVPTCLYSAFGKRVKEGGREGGKEGAHLMAVGAGEIICSPPVRMEGGKEEE